MSFSLLLVSLVANFKKGTLTVRRHDIPVSLSSKCWTNNGREPITLIQNCLTRVCPSHPLQEIHQSGFLCVTTASHESCQAERLSFRARSER